MLSGLLFGEKSFKTVCFDSFYFETGSYTEAQRLFKSFLARNELVASAFTRFLRASAPQKFWDRPVLDHKEHKKGSHQHNAK
jgi:hypothetical protein